MLHQFAVFYFKEKQAKKYIDKIIEAFTDEKEIFSLFSSLKQEYLNKKIDPPTMKTLFEKVQTHSESPSKPLYYFFFDALEYEKVPSELR